MTHLMEVRVHVAALHVSLVRAGELEADAALFEWADEWLNLDEEAFHEEFDDDA